MLNSIRCAPFICLLIFLGLIQSEVALAQSKSNKGTDFWVGFMRHREGIDSRTSLYITSDSSTTGTVSVPGQNWSQNFSVTANDVTVVTIPSANSYNECADCITSKAVRVVSNKDVVVYAHHYQDDQSDASLILPTRTLGKEYYCVGYNQLSPGGTGRNTLGIVSVFDSTLIKITPSIDLAKSGGGTYPANVPFYKTLQSGQFYQGVANSSGLTADITGTKIEVIDTGVNAACRRIAVFSGSSYVSILNGCPTFGITSGDNLFEQMFPTNSWGKQYVMVPSRGRNGDNFRILASENITTVNVFKSTGPPDQFVLNAGGYADIESESDVRFVSSNKPINVIQYQKTARCDGGGNRNGDPSMVMLTPLEQTLKSITLFSSNFFQINNHYINVVIPTFGVPSFRIDGQTTTFTPVPFLTSYSYARIAVTSGNHELKSDAGFVATAYGEGRFESYGYAAGANVLDLTATAAVNNSTKNNEIANCVGSPTRFAGNAEYVVTQWEWDFGDGNTSLLQNPSHIYQDTGFYSVKLLTYKNSFDGCSNYDSSFVDVRIYGKPTAKISTTPICDSSFAELADSSIIPIGETYNLTRWSINNGPTSFGQSINQFFDTIGTIPFRMIVSTGNFCTDTIIDSLVVSPYPEVSLLKNNVCFYDSLTLRSQSTLSSGLIDEYTWDLSDGRSYMGDEITHYIINSGYFSMTHTVTSDSGCVTTVEDSVYKYPQFDVSFSANDTCLGNGSVFANTSTKAGGNYTDTLWTTSLGDSSFAFDYNTQFDTLTDITIQLVMEQESFCRDTFIETITIYPLAIPGFTAASLCLGDTTQLLDASTLSSGTYTSSWNINNEISSAARDTGYSFSTAGSKSITLNIETENGCTTDTTQTIVITNPSITSINTTDICEGLTTAISSTNSSGMDSFNSYTWRVDQVQVSLDSSFDLAGAMVGQRIVTLDVTTLNGCEVSAIDSFEVFEKPNTNFVTTAICANETLEPVDNSTITAPKTITGYQWKVNDINVSTDQNPNLGVRAAGSYSLKLVTTSADGCTDSTAQVQLIYALPIGGFTTTDQCLNDRTLLTSTASVANSSIADVSWLVESTNYSANEVLHTFSTPGLFAVTQYLTSTQNCRDTFNDFVEIFPLPELAITLDSFLGCVPFTIDLEDNSTISSGSIASMDWDWGDGSTTNSLSPDHTYTAAGDYSIKVTAVSDRGCEDSINLARDVTVFENPTADFTWSPDEPSTITPFVTLTDGSTADAVQWDWTTSDGGFYTDQNTPHSFLDTGVYQVTLLVANSNGCEDEITKDIFINADLFVYIPTAFTPNGDELNDRFGLGGITDGVNKLTIDVYNRWGEKVFSSNDVNNKWDGTYQGEPAQQGVYIYYIEYTNLKQSEWFYYKGEINLLR